MAKPEKPAFRHPLISDVKNLIRIPIVNQATDYTCGVAAALSVLYYLDKGQDIYEVDLARILIKKKDDGVLSRHMIDYVEKKGFQAYKQENMSLIELEAFIREGKPVLVLLQAWPTTMKTSWSRKWRDGHWSVAIGFDDENYYFMDPSTVGNYTYIPKGEFLRRWHDYDGKKRVHQMGLVIWNGRSFDYRIAVPLE